MILEAGTVLARSYRLLHPIGEGGMGRVWVAEHIALDRRVAIKVMSEEVLSTPVARELFLREARATAKIEDPHVIRVLDFDVTDEGVPFLVLELLVGETLEERIVNGGPLPLSDARDLLEQICGALGTAHASGFLHRDIKAENVFLLRSSKGRVDARLLDFGIAQLKNEPTVGLVGPVGTPQYMSPEQLVAEPVDERSDLFSTGICMYYALTGVFPFNGETLAEIGKSFLKRATPVCELRPELPYALDAWFARALARDRDGRFASAGEMWSAFDRAMTAASRNPTRDTPLNLEVEIPDAALSATFQRRPRRALRWAAGVAALSAMIFAGVQPARVEACVASARQLIHPAVVAVDEAPLDVERDKTLGVSPFANAAAPIQNEIHAAIVATEAREDAQAHATNETGSKHESHVSRAAPKRHAAASASATTSAATTAPSATSATNANEVASAAPPPPASTDAHVDDPPPTEGTSAFGGRE